MLLTVRPLLKFEPFPASCGFVFGGYCVSAPRFDLQFLRYRSFRLMAGFLFTEEGFCGSSPDLCFFGRCSISYR